jgi:predicted MFS family arabinose efflux permease
MAALRIENASKGNARKRASNLAPREAQSARAFSKARKDLLLDALNFFLADVRGGLGPFVGVFLLTEANWTPAQIGGVLTVSGLIGIAFHTPIGALIDATRAKRGLVVLGISLLAVGAVAIERAPIGPVVLAADIVMALLGAVFAPTVAAITLGIVDPRHLAQRFGRNAVFDRAGNVFIAGLAGLVGWWLTQRAIFYLVPLFSIPAALAALAIPAGSIDHERARGLAGVGPGRRASWRDLLSRRDLLILAITVALFHFANASMLPLLGQKLALANPGSEAPWVSACILVAQLATIPAGLLVSTKADTWGRRPLLIAACVALTMRGLVFASFASPYLLVAAQVLDGMGGGLLDALLPLVLADMMQGTGRYNLARGTLSTIQGVGGSLSNAAGGLLVTRAGYDAAFAALSSVAAMALAVALTGIAETRPAQLPRGPTAGRSLPTEPDPNETPGQQP